MACQTKISVKCFFCIYTFALVGSTAVTMASRGSAPGITAEPGNDLTFALIGSSAVAMDGRAGDGSAGADTSFTCVAAGANWDSAMASELAGSRGGAESAHAAGTTSHRWQLRATCSAPVANPHLKHSSRCGRVGAARRRRQRAAERRSVCTRR